MDYEFIPMSIWIWVLAKKWQARADVYKDSKESIRTITHANVVNKGSRCKYCDDLTRRRKSLLERRRRAKSLRAALCDQSLNRSRTDRSATGSCSEGFPHGRNWDVMGVRIEGAYWLFESRTGRDCCDRSPHIGECQQIAGVRELRQHAVIFRI
jgi:hypothetical protein